MALRIDTHTLELNALADTYALAHHIGDHVFPGLCVALSGDVGAGKSTFARAVIQHLMGKSGQVEDVPSPTFTLVQTYMLQDLEIWHADLYRISHPDEVLELGLLDAFSDSLCLIEWPDRLGQDLPHDALRLHLRPGALLDQRICTLSTDNAALLDRLELRTYA